MVTQRHNRGCFVIQLSELQIGQILRLLAHLEPKVIEWAGENMTEEAGQELQEQVDRLAEAAERNDVAEFFFQDLTFHWCAVKALESSRPI